VLASNAEAARRLGERRYASVSTRFLALAILTAPPTSGILYIPFVTIIIALAFVRHEAMQPPRPDPRAAIVLQLMVCTAAAGGALGALLIH